MGGRTVFEIIQRFEKKLKDPRDNFKGKKNVKIIRDFLKINLPIDKAENAIRLFFLTIV